MPNSRDEFEKFAKRTDYLSWIDDLPAAWLDAALHWRATARTDQLPPEGEWTTWLFLGGRGAGKTRAGAEWVRALALAPGGEPQRIALSARRWPACAT